MKINHSHLKALMSEAGMTAEQLGAAIERPGLKGDAAVRAVRNWAAGKNQPRARKADIDAIADSLGVPTTRLATFVSTSRFVRSAPRKSRLVVDMIRGQRVDRAREMLQFSDRRAAQFLLKTLDTAIADAEQGGADIGRLRVTESRADAGVTIKRFQPKDRGRAHPIKKRTSHLTIGVEEVA
ncbi:MAG: 50S ribosomal protein L22 [Planctomycetota bacterium]|jgi:large subunit ribosomal protein L22